MQFKIGDKIIVVGYKEKVAAGITATQSEELLKRTIDFIKEHNGKIYTIQNISSGCFFSIHVENVNSFHPEEIALYNKYRNGTLNQGGNL